MHKSRRRDFRVSVVIPAGVTIPDMREYILEAVQTWHGSLRPPCSYSDDDPGDPLFSLDASTVRVNAIRTLDR
jgi:hypothetical protein